MFNSWPETGSLTHPWTIYSNNNSISIIIIIIIIIIVYFDLKYLKLLTSGGSHTHSPVVKLAYICSLVRGSIISTHSTLFNDWMKKKMKTKLVKMY